MPNQPKSKKILIADDERPIAQALELKFKHLGYDAKTVPDGEEALSTLAKEKFDLVLLDLIMPKVDGFGVLEEMQKRQDKTPVIISSNLSQEEDEKKAKALGAKDYFIKSNIPLSEVVERVKNILK